MANFISRYFDLAKSKVTKHTTVFQNILMRTGATIGGFLGSGVLTALLANMSYEYSGTPLAPVLPLATIGAGIVTYRYLKDMSKISEVGINVAGLMALITATGYSAKFTLNHWNSFLINYILTFVTAAGTYGVYHFWSKLEEISKTLAPPTTKTNPSPKQEPALENKNYQAAIAKLLAESSTKPDSTLTVQVNDNVTNLNKHLVGLYEHILVNIQALKANTQAMGELTNLLKQYSSNAAALTTNNSAGVVAQNPYIMFSLPKTDTSTPIKTTAVVGQQQRMGN